MANHNKTLYFIASKFGFGQDDNILRKAAEYERLLQTKSTPGNNLSVTSKLVICLDLAAETLGSTWDLKTAIKYSGIKASAYANCRKTIQNLLELNYDTITITSLCVSLQCTEVQNVAEKILLKYCSESLKIIDANLPQYVYMAVYQACRLNKVKISKQKFIEKSNLKPSQWTKLEQEFSKFVGEHFANNFVAKTTKKNKTEHDIIAIAEKSDNDPKNEDDNEIGVDQHLEPYEDWKKRMLEEAYREISQNKIKTKSPSKNRQKISPYSTNQNVNKSHQKLDGVKLTFLLN